MKILQINTVYKEKSTGRICFEVNKALEKQGHNGFIAYGKGKHRDKNAYRIESDIEYYFHNVMARITGLQGYFSFFATKRLIKYIKNISPDIIHLQNLHANYLHLPQLFKFLKKSGIPVILTLHDCWAFTGKCPHYTDRQCFKWKTGCFNCPAKHMYPQSLFFDRTKKLYADKKRWLTGIKDLSVIGVSKWISNQAKMSFLSNKNILAIYNWVDRSVFYPRKENVLGKYGIDISKFIILGVSASWTKGSVRYESFIKLSDLIRDDMQIVLVGNSKVSQFPENVKHIPYVGDINELAQIYSSADVFVHLSTQDAFGKVVAEAMACGTPVIVYNSTALPELVGKDCGYIVKVNDIQEVYECIQLVQKRGKNLYSDNCVKFVEDHFNYKNNVQQIINLYGALINDNLYH